MARNQKVSRQADIMESTSCCRHCQFVESRRQQPPAERWKEGHVIMNRYEVDPEKGRKHCYTGGQATWEGQTQTRSHHKPLEQEAYNGGDVHSKRTHPEGTEFQKDSHAGDGKHKVQNSKNTKTENRATQRTMEGGLQIGQRQTDMERKSTGVRKDNNDSSTSLKKQTERQTKETQQQIPGTTQSVVW